jgi:hypothetical protein
MDFLGNLLDCNMVRSGLGFVGKEPRPAGLGLKNIETGPDWKSGRSGPDI